MKEAIVRIMEMKKPSFCICAVFHCGINGSAHKLIVKTKDLGTSGGKFPRRMAVIGSFHFYQKIRNSFQVVSGSTWTEKLFLAADNGCNSNSSLLHTVFDS